MKEGTGKTTVAVDYVLRSIEGPVWPIKGSIMAGDYLGSFELKDKATQEATKIDINIDRDNLYAICHKQIIGVRGHSFSAVFDVVRKHHHDFFPSNKGLLALEYIKVIHRLNVNDYFMGRYKDGTFFSGEYSPKKVAGKTVGYTLTFDENVRHKKLTVVLSLDRMFLRVLNFIAEGNNSDEQKINIDPKQIHDLYMKCPNKLSALFEEQQNRPEPEHHGEDWSKRDMNVLNSAFAGFLHKQAENFGRTAAAVAIKVKRLIDMNLG